MQFEEGSAGVGVAAFACVVKMLAGLPAGYAEAQAPRVCWVPPFVSSAGDEAVELARMAKLGFDPWQEFALRNLLNERQDGKWAAFEAAVIVPRQNGKGTIIEGRELMGLFLLDDEQLLIHSAHQFDTSLEAFNRLLMLIEDCPELDMRVQRVSRSHGEEGIELKRDRRSGRRSRIRFRTRTKGGGKGFTGDFLAWDEVQKSSPAAHGALLPTLAARSVSGNPQVAYFGTAEDQQDDAEDAVLLARLRDRAVRGGDPSLMYVEWSADLVARLRALGKEVRGRVGPDDVDEEFARDPRVWMAANPGIGVRISLEHVAREQRSMSARKFAIERLNVPDSPPLEVGVRPAIEDALWMAMRDHQSRALNPVALAFHVQPDRSRAAVAAAGLNDDDLMHVEVVEHRYGDAWLLERLLELHRRHRPLALICLDGSASAALVPELDTEGVEVVVAGSKAHAQACGMLVRAVSRDALRHRGTQELRDALAGAERRKSGATWLWEQASVQDVSTLVAVSLAAWGRWTQKPRLKGRVEDYRVVQLVD